MYDEDIENNGKRLSSMKLGKIDELQIDAYYIDFSHGLRKLDLRF